MSLPGNRPDPQASLFAESLGRSPGRQRMQGRHVLVVGAGQRQTVDADPPIGNGRAIALLCAREGAQVACVDVRADAVEATVAAIRAEGGQAQAFVADVADAAAIPALVARCADAMNGLDGLAMVVGISGALPYAQLSAEGWDREFAVNVRSNMLFSQQALQRMTPGGSIVLMSSLAALRSGSGNPAYETAKAAQVALSRSTAMAGQSKAIRCNAVLPGLMDTPMGRDATRRRPGRTAGAALPFGRQGTGWEVAYATLFLLSHESSYVNGHALVVDGGLAGGIARPAG